MNNRNGDQTWERLLNWSEAQKASERLAGHILAFEGFKSIDPSHPLGGPDGGKDLTCAKDGTRWVAACYFPNGKKPFKSTLEKFKHDSRLIQTDRSVGFIFITNQNLSLAQREQLKKTLDIRAEIYHLERLVHILDQPANYGHRLNFLGIQMSMEEQVAFMASVTPNFVAIDEFRSKLLEDVKQILQEALPGQRR